MIAILLCTYNGASYLSVQLDSLLSQSFKDIVIYIHDDGSTDGTLDIINKYITKYPKYFFFVEDKEKHRGAGPSFMWLLNNVEADYYMFCDQDDYWLPFKVEHTFRRIKDVEFLHKNTPILVHTDLSLADKDLNITNQSFWEYQHYKVDISKSKFYISFGNIVTGCTMIINNLSKQVLFPYSGQMLHDYWIALKVSKYGCIENLKEQTILYRQHGSNEAGAGRKYNRCRINFKSFLHSLKNEIALFKDVSGKGYAHWLFYRLKYFVYRHFS